MLCGLVVLSKAKKLQPTNLFSLNSCILEPSILLTEVQTVLLADLVLDPDVTLQGPYTCLLQFCSLGAARHCLNQTCRIARVQAPCQLFGSKSRVVLLVAIIPPTEALSEKISFKNQAQTTSLLCFNELMRSEPEQGAVLPGVCERQVGNKFLQARVRNPTLLRS